MPPAARDPERGGEETETAGGESDDGGGAAAAAIAAAAEATLVERADAQIRDPAVRHAARQDEPAVGHPLDVGLEPAGGRGAHADAGLVVVAAVEHRERGLEVKVAPIVVVSGGSQGGRDQEKRRGLVYSPLA